MPKFAIRVVDPADSREYFLLWSTIVDAPTTYGMSREEFEEYWREEYGRQGGQNWPSILRACEVKGVAAVYYRDVGEVIAGNRAGPGETELTLEEILEQYCRNRPEEEEP